MKLREALRSKGGGGPSGRAAGGPSTKHRVGSKNTSFLNGLKHPEEALCIAPPVSNLCKGFVNTPVAF